MTPFSPRAMDCALTGAMLSVLRLENDSFNPNTGAGALDRTDKEEVLHAADVLVNRAWSISEQSAVKDLASAELNERVDEWASKAGKGGRILAYEKKGRNKDTTVPLLHRPGIQALGQFHGPDVDARGRTRCSPCHEHRAVRRWGTRLDAAANSRRR